MVDPSGRLADLARFVLSEVAEIQADAAAMSRDPEQPNFGWNVPDTARLVNAAENIARELTGYTEMPDARRERMAI